MATSGEASYQGRGAVGGKFRENSNRRESKKPYSRPSVAIRNSSAEKQTSWRPRIVENASRIVTESAHKLFSSVFRKNLQAIPMNSEANHELGDAFPEEVPYKDSVDQDHVNDGRDGLNNSSSGDVLNDLEQILKQKTFTQVELDRLTEVLRSRTSDVYAADEQKRFETSASQLVEAGRKGSVPISEKEVKSQTSLEPLSTPSGSSSFVDEDIASPTEIAKAYMGSRSSKLTPLTLGYRNQPFREDVLSQNGVHTPKPHIMSHVPRTSVPYASLPMGYEKDYLTPAPCGRYAIYSMARTPYSRVHHSAMLRTEGKAGPSISSQRSLGKTIFSGGRQTSKRRSSDLDSELGSVGPIRRIRRKTDMMSPSEKTGLPIPRASPSIPFTPIRLAASKHPISAVQKQFHLDGHTDNTSAWGIKENAENSIASKRFAGVPNQSRETAQKILEQLEKLVPSPKGKSCELKATGSKEAPSSKLMPGDNHRSSPRVSSSQKQPSVDENVPTVTSISEDNLGPKANGIVTALAKDTISSLKKTNAVGSCSVENGLQQKQPCEENGLQKKQPCEENANKDYHELEENSFSRQIGSNPSVAGKVKHDRTAVENKENSNGAVTVGCFSDIRNPGSFMLQNTSDAEASDNYPASEKSRGGTYPVTDATGTVAEPAPSTSLSPSSFNGTSSSSGPTGVKFSFPSKTLDKTTTCESSDLNGAKSEAKPKTMNSAGTGENVKDGNLFEHIDHSVSTSKLTSTAPVVFSFGASTSNGSPAPLPVSDTSTYTVSIPTAPPIFQFGSTTSATGSSSGVFVFGSQPASSSLANPSASIFSFTSTSPPPFPAFTTTDSASASASSGNDKMDVETKTGGPSDFAFPTILQTPFQGPASSFGLSAGGSFSIGTGGGGGGGDDKSNRRIIKVRRDRIRKR